LHALVALTFNSCGVILQAALSDNGGSVMILLPAPR
jgi:hypothetical protein